MLKVAKQHPLTDPSSSKATGRPTKFSNHDTPMLLATKLLALVPIIQGECIHWNVGISTHLPTGFALHTMVPSFKNGILLVGKRSE